MSTEFSRRSFLKGAGVTALGAAAAGMLAGCGQGYQVSASESPVNMRTAAASEVTPSWLGEAPEIAESEITETIDTEVLVVGCRTGGLPAMISAAENGAQVLGVERMAHVLAPREDIGAIDSRLQKESFAQFPEFQIDHKEALEDIVRYANGFVRYDLVKLWIEKSGEMMDWLTDIVERDGRFKMNFEGSIGTTGQGARDRAWAVGHSPQKLVDDENLNFGVDLQEYAESLGAQFLFNTQFIKLEQDDSERVTGIIAQDTQDLHYIRINASKGVILATGGYGNNIEMMEARQPWNMRSRIPCAPNSGSNATGDSIKAMLWCGAKMDPIGTSVMFNRACCKPDETADMMGTDGRTGQWFWYGEQPFMKVNLEGKRFCNESGPYDYMLHSAYMQPHQTYVDVWDANWKEHVRQMNEVGCCRLYPFDNGAPSNMDTNFVESRNQALLESGYIQTADTPEELAEKLNIPVEAFTETFNHYNEMARNGEDTDYYKEAYRMIPLDTPPYYGVRTGAWYLATIDGIIVDTQMRPLREDNTPIEGLYAVGDCSGGFFCVSYPNLFTGLACGRTFLWGKLAGEYAATSQA